MDENIFNVKSINYLKQNPFTDANNLVNEPKSSVTNPMHRLNGYDSSILNENLHNAESENFKLEFKISEKEREITHLNGQIKNAQIYGTQSEILSLRARKRRIENELFDLKRQKAEKEYSLKNLKSEKFEISWIKKSREFISRNVLAKVSKKFSKLTFLGDSLEKLSSINQNVDELIALDIPYGEKQAGYERLTEYLAQANKIHAQISKTMDDKT